jgi:indole-3-glycerol phosphate synthase
MKQEAEGFLTALASTARETVRAGYYRLEMPVRGERRSLAAALRGGEGRTRLIAEVKFESPVEGRIGMGDPASIALEYQRGGAAAVSVLTEPRVFGGRLEHLVAVKKSVELPVLMKDIVVDRVQVEAAARLGADAVLLIAPLFERGMVNLGLEETVGLAHSLGLEVMLEVHSEEEYERALLSDADIVGINNRSLETLEVSLDLSRRLLSRHEHKKPVVCESGIRTREEVLMLESLGADGFLVGTHLMKSADRARAVVKLTGG